MTLKTADAIAIQVGIAADDSQPASQRITALCQLRNHAVEGFGLSLTTTEADRLLPVCTDFIKDMPRGIEHDVLVHTAFLLTQRLSDSFWHQPSWDVLLNIAAARGYPRLRRRPQTQNAAQAMAISADYAARAMGHLLSAGRHLAAPGVDLLAPVIELVRQPGVPRDARHNLSRYVIKALLDRHGLGHRCEKGVVPPAVALPTPQNGVYTLAPNAIVTPHASSGYYYHMIAMLDANSRPICNSGCQFGPPSTLLDHWLERGGAIHADKRTTGLPTLLRTMNDLRARQPEQSPGRIRIDQSMLQLGRTIRQRNKGLYAEVRPLFAPELQPLIEKTRRQRVGIRRRLLGRMGLKGLMPRRQRLPQPAAAVSSVHAQADYSL